MMWQSFMIGFILSAVSNLEASKIGSDTDALSHPSKSILDNAPSRNTFTFKAEDSPTVTSFTEEIQYPGLRRAREGEDISPTLIDVSAIFNFFFQFLKLPLVFCEIKYSDRIKSYIFNRWFKHLDAAYA